MAATVTFKVHDVVVGQAIFRRIVDEFVTIKPAGAAKARKPDLSLRLDEDLADAFVVHQAAFAVGLLPRPFLERREARFDRPDFFRLAFTTPAFSSDSTLIAYVESAGSSSGMRLIVSDLTFNKQSVKPFIGDLLFTTNRDKTRIAAGQIVDNKLRVIDFSFAEPNVVHEGPRYVVIEKLTFGDDGVSVSYCALKGRTRLLVLDSREELLPKGLLPQLPVVRPDKKGVGLLLTSQNRYFLHQSFVNSAEKRTKYDEAADLAYSKDARFYVYAARKGENWFVVVNGKGPAFDRVVLPVFTPDGKRLVYRARKDGKRFLIVADTGGKTIKQHPAYEQVFQPIFTADGKSVVYRVKDGNKLICKVEGI